MAYDKRGNEYRVPRHVGIRTFFYEGSLAPDPAVPAVFILGQNPGWNEDQKGEPFIGESGRLVRKVFVPGAHLQEHATLYITNAVRCFTVGNAAPVAASIKACSPYSLADLEQIAAYHSETYVLCLGAVASAAFLKHMGAAKGKVSQKTAFNLNGHFFDLPSGRRVRHYSTKHPALVLGDRNQALIIRDHIQMLSEALQGHAPAVTRPTFVTPRYPNG